ncbi:MAG TPA: SBBP repeat-containing protein [Candidatus Eisenbacteria bacterium]|nr:SBBP repeat-containing protein [Candidatus Eisenbacteria bacterium]
MVVDAAGNIYITGGSTGSGTNLDYATIKYDAAGTEQWVRRYDGPSTAFASDSDNAAALAIDGNGNVFVTGSSSGDFATVKYSAAGTEMWVRRYNGPGAGADWATAIAVDASGNSYVSGSSYGNSTTQYDFATLSYDPSGTVRWTERYNGPGGNLYDTPHSIAVPPSGGVYVSGSSDGIGTGLDYATVKYARVVTSVESGPGDAAPGVFALQSNPNPFTPATSIRFTIPPGDRDHVRLAVYDVHGREVALLVNEVLAPGTYERELKGGSLASGVYWSRLQAGALSQTRKIIHVR